MPLHVPGNCNLHLGFRLRLACLACCYLSVWRPFKLSSL